MLASKYRNRLNHAEQTANAALSSAKSIQNSVDAKVDKTGGTITGNVLMQSATTGPNYIQFANPNGTILQLLSSGIDGSISNIKPYGALNFGVRGTQVIPNQLILSEQGGIVTNDSNVTMNTKGTVGINGSGTSTDVFVRNSTTGTGATDGLRLQQNGINATIMNLEAGGTLSLGSNNSTQLAFGSTGNTFFSSPLIDVNSPTTTCELLLQNTTSGVSPTDGLSIQQNGIDATIKNLEVGGTLKLGSNNASQMTFDATGNVSNSSSMTVQGVLYATGGLQVVGTTSTHYIRGTSSNTMTLLIQNTSSGTAVGDGLKIVANSLNAQLINQESGTLTIGTNSKTHFLLNSDGTITIGGNIILPSTYTIPADGQLGSIRTYGKQSATDILVNTAAGLTNVFKNFATVNALSTNVNDKRSLVLSPGTWIITGSMTYTGSGATNVQSDINLTISNTYNIIDQDSKVMWAFESTNNTVQSVRQITKTVQITALTDYYLLCAATNGIYVIGTLSYLSAVRIA